jgi:ribonuclease VapC
MVVDTSALAAIILREKERFIFDDLILRTPTAVMSVVSVVETMIVLMNKRLELEAARLDETLAELRIDVRGVDGKQGMLARRAFEQYGRGARLQR